MNWKTLLAASLLTFGGCTMDNKTTPTQTPSAKPVNITVQVDKPGPRINPAMWGSFFEDINFGADGGLYAEMVKNRSFEFPDAMMGWTLIQTNVASGKAEVLAYDPPRENNAHFLRITSDTANASRPGRVIGISNEGFRGMGVKAGELYDFSTQFIYSSSHIKITVQLVGEDGTLLASEVLFPQTDDTSLSAPRLNVPMWSTLTATLRPNATDAHARLALFMEGAGTVGLDMVSLFPRKTWMNRPGGLRADMVQMLADMHPGFLRFPGGCIVEGKDLAHRYQWKNTIGPVEDRKLLINRWNTEFPWRPTPDYFQSFGLGFFEYFQLAEDIGADPLPLVNCGMACQFNSGELCPVEELGPYIQDALDLIEFANGDASTTWGAKRAAMGHPAPFHLKMMGVGNEQWGPQFVERLSAFTKAIKAKYPDFQLVSDAGPSPEDERFQFLWPKLRELKADIVDEHCYANPIWFLSNSTRYDNYDRNGPKVFFGEYAAQSVAICSTKNRNNLECALSEAAYMTGLERNADVVRMASYAPLFAHIDAWQWTPDLMWTNNLNIIATPNYYVQKLYATNRGDIILPCTNDAPIHELLPTGRVGMGTDKSSAEFKDIKVTKGGATIFAADLSKDTQAKPGEGWHVTNGAFQQSDQTASVISYAGDPSWSDYTFSMKARKLAGENGFTITVCDNQAGGYARWILGGWGNTQNGILTHFAEQDQLLDRVPGNMETGRWYDVAVVMKGARMDCYLDGKLVQSAEVLLHKVPELFTSATMDENTGETILKVVNPGDQPKQSTIHLNGTKNVSPTGKAIVLTGALADENSFDKPANVAPMNMAVVGVGPEFNYTFKPRSMTVLRLGTK